MKKFCFLITAIVLFTFFSDIKAYGQAEDKNYYFDDSCAAVVFPSYSAYLKYAEKANQETLNGIEYIQHFDCLYVPAPLASKLNCISEIFITPDYCQLTFDLEGKAIMTSYYFQCDEKDYCLFYHRYKPIKADENDAGLEYYLFGNEYNPEQYYCKFNGSYFSVSSEISLYDMTNLTFVKVYFDSHLSEKGNKLYYINENGKKETGWKTVRGHKYFFRPKDGTAIKGRLACIENYVYQFTNSGICQGTYTGYALNQSGSKVYYKDGKISSDPNET